MGRLPLGSPTRGDVERSLFPFPSDPSSSAELAQGAGIGGAGPSAFANIDFGSIFDGREDWAELGCPDRI